MARLQNPNIEILEIAVRALGPICDDLVFLGGCATALLISDLAAPPVRATRDIDTITETTSIAEYHELGKRLRERGFDVDQSEGAPICRWTGHEVILDVMPIDETVLGFSNAWYASAIETAKILTLPSGTSINVIDAVHFLATKLVAFDGRGDKDYVMSHDLEDAICVLDGRPELEDEIEGAADDVREYVCSRLRDLLEDTRFRESLAGHLPGDPGSQARLPNLVARLERLAAIQAD